MLNIIIFTILIFIFYIGVAVVLNLMEHSYYRLGERQFRLGNIDEAICAFKEELLRNSDNVAAMFYLSRIYQELAVYPEAIMYLEAVLQNYSGQREINPLSVHAQLAKLYIKTHQVGKAFLSLTALRHNNVNSWEVYFYLGTLYVGQKLYDDAIKCFDEASQVNPEDFFSFYYSSLCSLRVGGVSRALKNLQESGFDVFETNFSEAPILLGFLLRFENFEKAAEVLERYADTCSNVKLKCQAYLLLGTCYSKIGKLQAAADSYHRGLSLFPGDTRILDELVINYAWILKQLEQTVESVSKFKSIEDMKILNFHQIEYREILTFLKEHGMYNTGREHMPALIERWNHIVSSQPCPLDIHDYIPTEKETDLKKMLEEHRETLDLSGSRVKNRNLVQSFLLALRYPVRAIVKFLKVDKKKRLPVSGEFIDLLNNLVSEDNEKSQRAFSRLSELGTKDAVVVMIDGIFAAPKEVKKEIVDFLIATQSVETLDGFDTYVRLYQKDNFTFKDHLKEILEAYMATLSRSWQSMELTRYRLMIDIFSRVLDENDHNFIDTIIRMIPALVSHENYSNKENRIRVEKFLGMLSSIKAPQFIRPVLSLSSVDKEIWGVKVAGMLKLMDESRIMKIFDSFYQGDDKDLFIKARDIMTLAFGSAMVNSWLVRNRSSINIMVITPQNFLKQTAIFYLKQAGFNIFSSNNAFHAIQEIKAQNIKLVVYDLDTSDMSISSFCTALKDLRLNRRIPIVAVGEASDFEISKTVMDFGVEIFISKPVEFDLLLSKVTDIIE